MFNSSAIGRDVVILYITTFIFCHENLGNQQKCVLHSISLEKSLTGPKTIMQQTTKGSLHA